MCEPVIVFCHVPLGEIVQRHIFSPGSLFLRKRAKHGRFAGLTRSGYQDRGAGLAQVQDAGFLLRVVSVRPDRVQEVLGGGELMHRIGALSESIDIIALSAEGYAVHAAERTEHHNARACEHLRICKAVLHGHLDNEIDTVSYSDLCSGKLVEKSRLASLNIVAAHDGNDIISACQFLGLLDLIDVSVVEGVVFAYDTIGLHWFSVLSFFLLSNIVYAHIFKGLAAHNDS